MEQNKDMLGEILERQSKKVQQLDQATLLIKSKHYVKDELQEMHNLVEQTSQGNEDLRKILEKMKHQNACFIELLSRIGALDKKIAHQRENIPQELIQNYQNTDQQGYNQTASASVPRGSAYKLPRQNISTNLDNNDIIESEVLKDCKRILFNEPKEVCPKIQLITAEEYSNVPKYMIGRQGVEILNSFIKDINETLIAKYTILTSGKSAAQKKGQINLYLQYKKQELDVKEEKGYLYFFTAEDYYRQTKKKIDKTKLNLITALRHCKRLREYRKRNELLYVIINCYMN